MRQLPVISIVAGILLLLFLSPVAGQEGLDEWEPNDQRLLADEITGFMIEGEIGGSEWEDMEDWYILTGQQGNSTEFILTHNPDLLDLAVEIYSGEILIATLPDFDDTNAITAEVPDPCIICVMALEGSGCYSIAINPLDPGVRCEGDSEEEPNDEQMLADPISQPVIEGYACREDNDWFKLEWLEEGPATVNLIYDDTAVDIDCLVYSNDLLLGVMDETSSPDSFELEITGDIYLYVYAFEGEGAYSIEIVP